MRIITPTPPQSIDAQTPSRISHYVQLRIIDYSEHYPHSYFLFINRNARKIHRDSTATILTEGITSTAKNSASSTDELPCSSVDCEFLQSQNIASDRMSGVLRRIEFVTQTRN